MLHKTVVLFLQMLYFCVQQKYGISLLTYPVVAAQSEEHLWRWVKMNVHLQPIVRRKDRVGCSLPDIHPKVTKLETVDDRDKEGVLTIDDAYFEKVDKSKKAIAEVSGVIDEKFNNDIGTVKADVDKAQKVVDDLTVVYKAKKRKRDKDAEYQSLYKRVRKEEEELSSHIKGEYKLYKPPF